MFSEDDLKNFFSDYLTSQEKWAARIDDIEQLLMILQKSDRRSKEVTWKPHQQLLSYLIDNVDYDLFLIFMNTFAHNTPGHRQNVESRV